MDKPQKYVNGNVLIPIRMGNGVSIVNNDKVTFTSRVMAVHEMSSNRVVLETMNTLYIVESRDSDVCVSFAPAIKRKNRFFSLFRKKAKT